MLMQHIIKKCATATFYNHLVIRDYHTKVRALPEPVLLLFENIRNEWSRSATKGAENNRRGFLSVF